MDKTRTNWLFDCLMLAFIALILVLFLTSNVLAQHLNWSFTDHPPPEAAELTDDEVAAIMKVEAKYTQSEPGKYCEEVPRAYFQIYNARYPAFAKINAEPTRYLAWKAHIIAQGMPSPATCIVGDLGIKLMRSMSVVANTGLVFCGKYSRNPQNPQEKQLHEYLNELVRYAQTGSIDATSDLLVANSNSPPVSLNPDIEYYLRKTLERSGEYDWNWDTSHLKPLLEKDRLTFLDEAIKNQHLAAVLQSTEPCIEH